MRSRFVEPETRRLALTDGDWLLVKRRLTAGEQRAAFARQYTLADDGTWRVDPLKLGTALILAYLIDWSLVDARGSKVVIVGQPLATIDAALNALDVDDFAEIRAAIQDHEREMIDEREAEKKTRNGGPSSPAISPSLVGVGGGTNG